MPKDPWKPGRVLAGRYRLETRLGEGGMGSIWRAEHLVLAAPVAVKLIDPDIAADEDAVGRFMREAQSAAALRSPHVVQILDYGVDHEENTPFIVMELLEGENLAQRIKRLGRLSPGETVRVMSHVARAVMRAHEAGVIHRDLKPENVFIVKNEDEELAKVLDFGVAKNEKHVIGPNAKTRTGSLLGTPYYMSPEQAQGNPLDYRSDLWSLGVIAFECLTGKRPFYSDAIGDLVLQICVRDLPVPSRSAPVPPRFDAWFKRAVARDPENRFQSARELVEALREALGVESRETIMALSDESGARPLPMDPTSSQPTVIAAPGDMPIAASAATLAVSGPQKPSLTMRQFGTSSVTPPPTRSGAPIVLGVALTALVAGVAFGFIALRGRLPLLMGGGGESPPLVPDPSLLSAAPAASAPPLASALNTVSDGGLVTTDAAASGSVDASAAPAQIGKDGRALRKDKGKSDATKEVLPPLPQPARDGGWHKPQWAMPDEEVAKPAPAPPPEPKSTPP